MFRKVLIANRGEIAVRILRACHEMATPAVCVFSEVDRTALHVRLADEAYFIGPAPSRESYLRIDKLIDVARRTGCDAIHPGYGFLAENPAFARACADAGITFIGPSPESMETMGSKTAGKQLARRADVPTVPGNDQPIENPDEALMIAAAPRESSKWAMRSLKTFLVFRYMEQTYAYLVFSDGRRFRRFARSEQWRHGRQSLGHFVLPAAAGTAPAPADRP